MPKLSEVVYSVLADLTFAQDKTNKLTRLLSAEYQRDKVLQYLPVPNADIEEVELTLRFAVTNEQLAHSQQKPLRWAPSQQWLWSLAYEISQHVAWGLVGVVTRRRHEDAERQKRLVAALASSEVRQALSKHLFPVVERAFSVTGAVDVPAVVEALKTAVAAALSSDEDFQGHVKDGSRAVDEAIASPHKEAIEAILSGAAGARAGAAEEAVPSIEVLLDSKTLSGLEERAIQTLKIKAAVRNYRWVLVSGEQQLVPQDD